MVKIKRKKYRRQQGTKLSLFQKIVACSALYSCTYSSGRCNNRSRKRTYNIIATDAAATTIPHSAPSSNRNDDKPLHSVSPTIRPTNRHIRSKRTSSGATTLPPSSSWQTLEKLQQMLDGTDYLSSSSSSSSSESTSPLNHNFNDSRKRRTPTHRHPFVRPPPPPPPPRNQPNVFAVNDLDNHDVDDVSIKRTTAKRSRSKLLSRESTPPNYNNIISEERGEYFPVVVDDSLNEDEQYSENDLQASGHHIYPQQQRQHHSTQGIRPVWPNYDRTSRLDSQTITTPSMLNNEHYYESSIPTSTHMDHQYEQQQQQQQQDELRPDPQRQVRSSSTYHHTRYDPSLNVHSPPTSQDRNEQSYSNEYKGSQSSHYLKSDASQQQFSVPQQQQEYQNRYDRNEAKLYNPTPSSSSSTRQQQKYDENVSSLHTINDHLESKSYRTSTIPTTTSDKDQHYHQQQQHQIAIIHANDDYDVTLNQVQSIVEAGSRLTFGSIQKISLYLMAISLLSYAGVSPSTLPLTEYNLQFYDNFRLVCLSTIAPAIYLSFVFDAKENDINSVTNTFVVTFFVGYFGIFLLEIACTTVYRLLLFLWLEPMVFSLSPTVPIPVLPWVLRDWQYRPKRITLFAADFGTSCIICPMIEECSKLLLLQRLTELPKNFKWTVRKSSNRKSKRLAAELVTREYGKSDCTSANHYVTQMLTISVAIKLADAARRILLYTKSTNANKGFYAICRGIFPIHELCGVMTAIALAKRDLLGVNIPLWKLLAPAVVVHGMANFRGKKPLFKWNSSSPWSEMQLAPLNIPDSSTFLQLVKKGYAKLMWVITISRVFGYCVKNYYMVNRHALKRTTKYAGNHAAFSAELVTTELLKNLKK